MLWMLLLWFALPLAYDVALETYGHCVFVVPVVVGIVIVLMVVSVALVDGFMSSVARAVVWLPMSVQTSLCIIVVVFMIVCLPLPSIVLSLWDVVVFVAVVVVVVDGC